MDIIFHKKQKDIFLQSFISGILSHAYIIEGQSGIGKKTFAFFAAKTILCNDKSNRPCGKCNSCKKVDQLSHPDLQYLSASESGSFKVESVRDLIKTVYYLPNESDKKVYIFDMAQKMTLSAQNAMLKVFEEPPSSAVFFILTEKRDALLPTVLSRGQMIALQPPEDKDIIAFLSEKYPKKSIEELKTAAEIAGNIPGASIACMDKSFISEREKALKFVDLLFSENRSSFSIYTFLLPAKSKRETVLSFLDSLIFIFKEMLVCKLTGKECILTQSITEKNKLGITENDLSKICDLTINLYTSIESNGNLTSCIADYCSDLIEIIKSR